MPDVETASRDRGCDLGPEEGGADKGLSAEQAASGVAGGCTTYVEGGGDVGFGLTGAIRVTMRSSSTAALSLLGETCKDRA